MTPNAKASRKIRQATIRTLCLNLNCKTGYAKKLLDVAMKEVKCSQQ